MTDSELIQKQALRILEQKEEIERLQIELARIKLILQNLNAPQK